VLLTVGAWTEVTGRMMDGGYTDVGRRHQAFALGPVRERRFRVYKEGGTRLSPWVSLACGRQNTMENDGRELDRSWIMTVAQFVSIVLAARARRTRTDSDK